MFLAEWFARGGSLWRADRGQPAPAVSPGPGCDRGLYFTGSNHDAATPVRVSVSRRAGHRRHARPDRLGTEGEVYFTGDHYGQGAGLDAYYVNPTP
jgi:hypothetical protein